MNIFGITKRHFYAVAVITIILSFIISVQSCKDEDIVDTEEETTDDITFEPNSKDTTFSNAVVITFSGTTATVTNPFESSGVTSTINNGDVVVTSTIADTEINYVLSGIATEGSFKLYSDYKTTLVLNGVGIVNSDGPAINIQSGKKTSVNVLTGTTNKLIDGVTYTTSEEDQKGAFFSEGQLIFSGTGVLSVTGKYKHGICSDDYISITQGNITIVSAASDGIHANDYFDMEAGTLTVTSSGDGIDCEEGYVNISGGNITVASIDDGITASYDGTDAAITPYVQITGAVIGVTTTGDKGNAIKSEGAILVNSNDAIILSVSGKASKGFKSSGDFTITNGNANIITSGAAFYDTDDADIAASAGINCDGNFTMDAGTLTITSSGAGGKGISVDGMLTVNDGTININASGSDFTYSNQSSEAKGIKSNGAILVQGGSITISATDDGIKSEESIDVSGGEIVISKSTEGIEAPIITFSDGTISVVSSDDCTNATKGTGGESNDGSLLTFAGGTISLNSSGGDPIDSNGNVVMTGGNVIVQGPPSSPEVAIDYNGTFKISGGLLIASGPSGNMIQATSTSSTQHTALIKINGNVSANTLVNIQDASGNSLVTYAPIRNAYYFVFSSPALQSGATYKVYSGGSVSGGTKTNGLTLGGTYSGGTQKGSFTINNALTTANL